MSITSEAHKALQMFCPVGLQRCCTEGRHDGRMTHTHTFVDTEHPHFYQEHITIIPRVPASFMSFVETQNISDRRPLY